MKQGIKKVSFEFDNTLEQEDYQKLAKEYINMNYSVFVITSRSKLDDNQDLFSVCSSVGILNRNILFTEKDSKVNLISVNEIDIHFDGKAVDVQEIKKYTGCIAILTTNQELI